MSHRTLLQAFPTVRMPDDATLRSSVRLDLNLKDGGPAARFRDLLDPAAYTFTASTVTVTLVREPGDEWVLEEVVIRGRSRWDSGTTRSSGPDSLLWNRRASNFGESDLTPWREVINSMLLRANLAGVAVEWRAVES